MKIKKIPGVYFATIAQAVKDANFRKEDGSVMTQGEINEMFKEKLEEGSGGGDVTYRVENVRSDKEYAFANETSMKLFFDGYTITTKSNGESFETSQEVEAVVTFPQNTDISESVLRSGNFMWNGQEIPWSVIQYRDVRVGDVLCSDGTSIRPLITSDDTVESLSLNGKTPIGVCVMPLHYNDGKSNLKSKYISLDFMSCENPDNGSQTDMPMCFGGNAAISPAYSTYDFRSYTAIARTRAQYNAMTKLSNDLYMYPQWYSEVSKRPVNADGTVNVDFFYYAFSVIGKTLTTNILAQATSSWGEGEIVNSYEAGNYPAACCCSRYHTQGTDSGEWYLPNLSELIFTLYNLKLIDNVMKALKKASLGNSIFLTGVPQSSSNVWTVSMDTGVINYKNRNSNNSVRAFIEKEPFEYVDLGLPSGLLWAKHNIGASSPEEYGMYFQWGSVNGHFYKEKYNFSSNNYPEKGTFTNLTLSKDAAHVIMGGDWRMPTENDFEELIDNTIIEETSVKDTTIIKCTSKKDSNRYILIPQARFIDGTSIYNYSRVCLWSSSNASYFLYSDKQVMISNNLQRYYGLPIRGVKPRK